MPVSIQLELPGTVTLRISTISTGRPGSTITVKAPLLSTVRVSLGPNESGPARGARRYCSRPTRKAPPPASTLPISAA